MKRIYTLFFVVFASLMLKAQTIDTLQGDITADRAIVNTKIWILKGNVYIKNGATLTIPAGTIIKGLSKSALIVTRGAKLIAEGTVQQPIIFTSAQVAGQRNIGDWGGIVILGKATTNTQYNSIQGVGQIEGGIDNAAGDGQYGGTDDADNSGSLKYVRIEYGGFPFEPNKEVNSLTMGGVGSATKIEYIQTSFGGDDDYEWFGGTVNAKYLVSYANTDDNFDTDLGYRGNVQFAVALRDTAIADGAGASNGFESDNDAAGSNRTPFTANTFSNMTVLGPMAKSTTLFNTKFGKGALIRLNSRTSIFNSIIAGWPVAGLDIDGKLTAAAAVTGDLKFKNNILAENKVRFVEFDSIVSATTVRAWFAANANDSLLTYSDIKMKAPFNYKFPLFDLNAGSSAATGASFTDARVSGSFFTPVTYRGAFGTTNWMAGWTNFNPQAESYNTAPYNARVAVKELTDNQLKAVVAPNPVQNNTTANVFFSVEKPTTLELSVVDLMGRTVVKGQKQFFTEGAHAAEINVQNMAIGLYFVHLVTADGQKALPLTVVK
jgi:Secretion system C-terminal sorting domain